MSEKPSAPEFNKEDFLSLFFNASVPFNYKFFLVAGLLVYSISPVDLIPEVIFGPFGLADDVGIAIAAAQMFTHFANKALEQKQTAQAEAAAAPPAVMSAQAAVEDAPPAPNRLPRHHIEQAQATAAAPRPATPPAPRPGDALSDEAHEQYLLQKHAEKQDEFERRLNDVETRQQTDWDYSRNDPFRKKPNSDTNRG
jgi:uncharacterized membrane protein YkvA (DUF1232 family)